MQFFETDIIDFESRYPDLCSHFHFMNLSLFRTAMMGVLEIATSNSFMMRAEKLYKSDDKSPETGRLIADLSLSACSIVHIVSRPFEA